MQNPHLRFHHLGLAVRRPEEARKFIYGLGYNFEDEVFDPAQNVYLQLCTHKTAPSVEIIWPGKTEGAIHQLVQRQVAGIIYHICFETDNLNAALADFNATDLHVKCISAPTPAPLFGGRHVSFYYVLGIGLIEILE